MEDYEELCELGRGSYGTVFKCKRRATGEIVAIKQMKDEDGNEVMRKTAIREAKILKQLQHPNVVRLIELFRSKTRLYMVFEYMDRSILKLLENNPRGLPAMEVKKILWQLVLALNFLHNQQIIHRDLKPENILTDDAGAVKLADFGFARPQTVGGHNLSPYVATRWYRAPELLVGDTYGPGVDVWALGCLLVELTTGQPLFPGKSNADQLWLILRTVGYTQRQLSRMKASSSLSKVQLPKEEDMVSLDKRYSQMDRASLSLLKACLDPEPKNRPTSVQLLTHEYFSSAKPVLMPYTAAAAKATIAAKQPGAAAPPAAAAAAAAAPSRPAAAAAQQPPAYSGHDANQDTIESLPERTIASANPFGLNAAPQASHKGAGGGKPPPAPHAHPPLPPHAHPPLPPGGPGGRPPPVPPVPAGGERTSREGSVDAERAPGATGSDGGDAKLDDEYEDGPEEVMSPEARARVQRWLDAMPDLPREREKRAVQTALSNATPGGMGAAMALGLQHSAPGVAAAAHTTMQHMHPGLPMGGGYTSPTNAYGGDASPLSPGFGMLGGAFGASQHQPGAGGAGGGAARPPSALNALLQGGTTLLTSNPPPVSSILQQGHVQALQASILQQQQQQQQQQGTASPLLSPADGSASPGPGLLQGRSVMAQRHGGEPGPPPPPQPEEPSIEAMVQQLGIGRSRGKEDATQAELSALTSTWNDLPPAAPHGRLLVNMSSDLGPGARAAATSAAAAAASASTPGTLAKSPSAAVPGAAALPAATAAVPPPAGRLSQGKASVGEAASTSPTKQPAATAEVQQRSSAAGSGAPGNAASAQPAALTPAPPLPDGRSPLQILMQRQVRPSVDGAAALRQGGATDKPQGALQPQPPPAPPQPPQPPQAVDDSPLARLVNNYNSKASEAAVKTTPSEAYSALLQRVGSVNKRAADADGNSGSVAKLLALRNGNVAPAGTSR